MQILGCREGRVLHSDPEWKMDVKEARLEAEEKLESLINNKDRNTGKG